MAKDQAPPATKPTPPPVKEIAGERAGEAMQEFMKTRKGKKSTWITRGQSMGGGTNLV